MKFERSGNYFRVSGLDTFPDEIFIQVKPSWSDIPNGNVNLAFRNFVLPTIDHMLNLDLVAIFNAIRYTHMNLVADHRGQYMQRADLLQRLDDIARITTMATVASQTLARNEVLK